MANKTTMERTLETLVELVVIQRDHDERNFDKVTNSINELVKSIEHLTLNVGQLTSQQRATNADIKELTQAIREQNQNINGHLAVAQAQAANIAELTKLATVIVSSSR